MIIMAFAAGQAKTSASNTMRRLGVLRLNNVDARSIQVGTQSPQCVRAFDPEFTLPGVIRAPRCWQITLRSGGAAFGVDTQPLSPTHA